MNVTQKLLILTSTLGLASGVARGQTTSLVFEFEAETVGNYRQGPTGVSFEGGTFGINVRDGQALYDGCHDVFFYLPSQPCPVGATGFISRGLENDPLLAGLGPYFSITDLSPARALRPFDPGSALLISAPPSTLPRPLVGFEDQSLSVFFNLLTDFIRQHPITTYDYNREYAANERSRFDGEVVPGTYRYNFGSLASPTIPVVLAVNHFPMLDGFRKVNNQKRGLRFTNVTYDDGFAIIDPFVLNELTWEGNTASFISPGPDVAYLSIKPLANPNDPLSDPVLYDGLGDFVFDQFGNLIPNPTIPLFPNFAGLGNPRTLLPNPLDTSFIIPPSFIRAGQSGVIDLEFVIFRPTSPQIYERSTRRFRLPVRVLDPFESSILAALPPGADPAQMAANFDFDGDGVSNFDEWVFGSDPAKASSVPTAPGVMRMRTAPAVSVDADLSTSAQHTKTTASDGGLEYSVAKRINPVPALKYSIEYSPDMVTWTEITSTDVDWKLEETYKEIKVTETGASPKKGGFFRTKVQTAN